MSLSHSVNVNWKLLIGVLAGLLIIGMFSGSSGQQSSSAGQQSQSRVSQESNAVEWKKVNFLELDLPANIQELRDKVKITSGKAKFFDQEIFYQTGAVPAGVSRSGRTVLLLHGAAFTSQTWIDKVPTLRTLAALGHGVIAIDLPGYGKSRQASVPDNGEFLARLIQSLAGKQPIVVSPSMSGSFIIPMLANPQYRDLISGWVPVAPVSTGLVASFGSQLLTPTLIVVGEKDRSLGNKSKEDLKILPNATLPQVLPGAGHPAYLDQPDMWHKLLHNFIIKVNQANSAQLMEA